MVERSKGLPVLGLGVPSLKAVGSGSGLPLIGSDAYKARCWYLLGPSCPYNRISSLKAVLGKLEV